MIKYEKYESTKLDYQEGYRNGRADRLLGLSPLIVALTSTWPSYATGYDDGYNLRWEQDGSQFSQVGRTDSTKGART